MALQRAVVMELLPDEIEAPKGAEKDVCEGRLILFFDEKNLLGGLDRFVARGVADLGKDEACDFDVFEVEFEKHWEKEVKEFHRNGKGISLGE